MQYGTVQMDDSTKEYFNSAIGRLKQYSRVKLQWLCTHLQIPYDPEHTTGEFMISEILKTQQPVPLPHEVERPKNWGQEKLSPVNPQDQKPAVPVIAEPKEQPAPDIAAEQPEPPATEESPHGITNLMSLRKFMKDRGFAFNWNTSTREDLLALWDNREVA